MGSGQTKSDQTLKLTVAISGYSPIIWVNG